MFMKQGFWRPPERPNAVTRKPGPWANLTLASPVIFGYETHFCNCKKSLQNIGLFINGQNWPLKNNSIEESKFKSRSTIFFWLQRSRHYCTSNFPTLLKFFSKSMELKWRFKRTTMLKGRVIIRVIKKCKMAFPLT